MPPPGTGVLSFGLVAIPVRIHTATHSENVSFNLLHHKCGSRVRNQHYCPVCNIVVERADLVRGFQHAKDQYVTITEEELESLEAEANRNIDLKEFIPLASVDLVYFENTLFSNSRELVQSSKSHGSRERYQDDAGSRGARAVGIGNHVESKAQ
jgi:Ku protein